MNTPRNTKELTQQIEQLVERYVADGRRAVRDAVDRAFGAAMPLPVARTKASASANASRSRRSSAVRRTPEEVAQLGVRLYELVRARPGESMTVFAGELEIGARELERPMALLKREGRVRSVGLRHMTRYFPAVGSRVTASAQ